MGGCERVCTGTVQLHPTRHCNLRCRHCYSLSGPEERDALPARLLIDALADARAQGYGRVSFSGGEPMLYRGLQEVLRQARALGMLATLTTNGIPLTERRVASLAGLVDLIAISLDGRPETHDALRGPHAFDGMQVRLPLLRASGIPFGFIFTLTRDSMDDLAWVATFAIESGAALLQVHPLEETGRAAVETRGQQPDELVANAAYLAFMRLQDRVGERIALQLDLAHRDLIRAEPWRVYADAEPVPGDLPLAALVDTLVVETDGLVVPLQYGFPRAHALGRLGDAPLAALGARWRNEGYGGFRAHCRRVFEESLLDPEALPAFNWFEALSGRTAGQFSSSLSQYR
ncbi:radical SAM protein [Roseomonas rosulenta]|uniref:radical SAM protein n=1 Tax=Roseomonas rosulenta TaxID=2748667 RepID=UPI0018DFB735|nr:radical SAM protein [Roseomonas rosulenta]